MCNDTELRAHIPEQNLLDLLQERAELLVTG
jgi:hypothetical protein